jgi:hypothetical protein
VACRPTPEIRHEVEHASLNVLALPVAGVFALHDGPRRHVVATPSHAVFISCGLPYRVSFPGNIGDDCLTLRLTARGSRGSCPKPWRATGSTLSRSARARCFRPRRSSRAVSCGADSPGVRQIHC